MQLSHILLLTIAVVLLASVQSSKSSPVPVPKATTNLTATAEPAAADLEIELLAKLPMTNTRFARKLSSWSSDSTGSNSNSMRRGKLLNLNRRIS